MSKSICKRLVSIVLMLLIVLSCVPMVFAANSGSAGDSGTISARNLASYTVYKSKYPYVKGVTPIEINPTQYDETGTTADVEILTEYAGKTGALLKAGDSGSVTWTFNVQETGFYALYIDYCSASGKMNTIERTLYVNGRVPFTEARDLQMFKRWENTYVDSDMRAGYSVGFQVDPTGNELRPASSVSDQWQTYVLRDANGYVQNPLEVYLEAGENKITLTAVREPVVFGTITLKPYEELKSYADVLAEYEAKGYKVATGASTIKLQAEIPDAVSNYTIYPTYDRSSAITEPQDATKIRFNTIGGDKWKSSGTWIEYSFTCEKTGLYNIVTRFKQNGLDGLYVSRRIYINGEIPFEEANLCQFAYNEEWQVAPLSYHYGSNDKDVYNFEFYFEEGKTYTVRFEVTVGYLGEVIDTVTNALNSINTDYLQILKLTGANPDENRSYRFAKVMPETIKDLYKQSEVIQGVIDYLTSMSGVKGANITTLEQTQILLAKMGSDEDQIASNLSTLKTYIGSLGTWINTINSQPLTFDYITIQPVGQSLPKADANMFESLIYQIKQFIGSFFSDYNSLGGSDKDKEAQEKATDIEVWFTTGRDQAQIVRSLVDNSYRAKYPYASVNLKLVASGTLLPSVLAGSGPDVALSGADTINYAIRNAVLPLNGFDTFNDVAKRFSQSAIDSLSLYGVTYGLPDTQSFPMMFYRTDILAELGVEVPKTWDDMLSLIPILQYNNMTIGLRKEDFTTYLYQMGGDQWADDGMRINFDSNTALEAFEMMCNMFTQFSLDVSYDMANRLRTGEMPIAIANYTIYNTLIVFATEIAGLWEFGPIPGMLQADGTINNVATSSAVGITMMKGCEDQQAAWNFMDWYTDKDFQTNYSNELVAVLGDCAKNPTANMEALEELDWTASEYNALISQFNKLVCVKPYPGDYIVSRYTEFAFLAAYNDLADPVEQLLGYIASINKEITRKRTEFGLETLDNGQRLADKRMGQAKDALALLTDSKYASAIEQANKAISESNIELLEAASATLASFISGKTFTVDITKQTVAVDKGGYAINSLNTDELVYFASECLASAAYWLSTY